MNKIIKLTFFSIILLLSFSILLNSVFAHNCELVGNYYDCKTDNSISGDLSFYDKGVWIHDITITINGADGTSGSMNGVEGQLSIQTNGKVLIENSTITINGGDGYSQNDNDGGNGGISIFEITGDGHTEIKDTIINLNGGDGGNGDAYCDNSPCSAGEYGGFNGYIKLELSSEELITNNLTINGISGIVGNSDSTCKGDDEDGQSGRSAYENSILIKNSKTNISGTISFTGGRGGHGDECGSGRAGDGGDGGDNNIIINSTNLINNITFHITGGTGGDCSADDSGDGGDGGTNTLTITSNETALISNYNCNPGTPGQSDGSDGVQYDGYIGTCNSYINSKTLIMSGSFNHEDNSFNVECRDTGDGTQSCNGRSGKDSSLIINSTENVLMNNLNLSIKSTHGGYPTSVDRGNGGKGGDVYFDVFTNELNITNSQIDILPAEGRNADCSSTSYLNGYGGSIFSDMSAIIKINSSDVLFKSGNSGLTSACTSENAQGAGSILIDFQKQLNISNSNFSVLVGKNAPYQSSNIKGIIDFKVEGIYSTNSILEFHIGKEGYPNGKYLNVSVSDLFLLENSDFSIKSNGTKACRDPKFNLNDIALFESIDSNIYVYSTGDTGTCDSYLIANGEEFNFMNNTELELTSTQGIGKMNISLFSNRTDLPGIMRWNYSEIGDAITTNILSSQTTYNSSRGFIVETGTWSWNDSVYNVIYDDYFTRIQDVKLSKTSSDKGPEFYNNTYFVCKAKVNIGKHLINIPLINFSIYNNGVYFGSDNDAAIIDNEYVTSTTDVSKLDTDLGDNWTCNVKVYNVNFTNELNETEQIVHRYPYNVTIYIGNKGQVAGQLLNQYLKNEVNVPIERGTINEYIQNNCSSFPCTIPLEFRSDTGAIINVSEVSFTYGVSDPVNESTQSTTNYPLMFNSSQEGELLIDDVYFLHESDEQTSIRIKGGNEGFYISHWIDVLYSKFTFNLTPKEIDYYDVYPLWSNQKNVEPFGQNSRVSIYNLTRMNNTNHSFELRMGIVNGTSNDCTDIYFSESNNINNKFEVNEGVYTSLSNFTWSNHNNTQLWSWVDFNSCSSEDIRYFFPEFVVKAKAYGTVNSTGFWDDLE